MAIRIEKRDDVLPICPHCSKPVTTLWHQELVGFLGRRYIYFCPNCQKVLGVTHRKGFFMG